MRLRSLPWIVTALLCALGAPAMAQSSNDWVEIKNPQELRELYSNKTWRGSNNSWVGHYRANGKGIFIRQGRKPSPLTWEVKGEDQGCTTLEGGTTKCSRFQRNRKSPNQLLVTTVQSDVTFNFTLEDGIPKF